MGSKKSDLNRRSFLKKSIYTAGVAAGSLIVGPVFGQMLTKETPRQVLGPYFPEKGTPNVLIQESLDFRLPIAEGNDNDLTFIKGGNGTAEGQIIYIQGQVKGTRVMPENKFGLGEEVIPGATIVLWQASASGRYNHKGDSGNFSFKHPKTGELVHRKHDENFQYWGRAISDKNGNYWFKTVVPGFYPVYGGFRTAHLHFMIMAPRYPELVTQTYFKGEKIQHIKDIEELNSSDFVLHDNKNTPEEQERLIIEYREDPTGKRKDGLVGNFDFYLVQ